ncbi:MAG TPA: response regulator transcription factor [Acholeplasmataceae bacterium]|nr:response regulator transcription factor [Acholeplasmataceae bacterium]
MNILIVEDYQKINDLLAHYLRSDGHHVMQTTKAIDALHLLKQHPIDVILLDLMLPDMSGEDVIKEVRRFTSVYIMVISAKVDIEGRINTLSLGADDYLVKPFSVEEVLARLKNVEKRLSPSDHTIFSFNQEDLKIVLASRDVFVDGSKVNLTKDEYDLLIFLIKHPSRSFSRDELITLVLPHSQAYDRVIDTHIKNIRQKIDIHPFQPSYIKTHYGLGYQFIGQKDE